MSESPSTALVRDICPPRRVCVSQGRRCHGADDCIEMGEIDRTFFQIQSQSTHLPDLFVVYSIPLAILFYFYISLYRVIHELYLLLLLRMKITTPTNNTISKRFMHHDMSHVTATFSVALFTYTRSTSRNYY